MKTPKNSQTVDQRIVAAAVKPDPIIELTGYLKLSEGMRWRPFDTVEVLKFVREILESTR